MLKITRPRKKMSELMLCMLSMEHMVKPTLNTRILTDMSGQDGTGRSVVQHVVFEKEEGRRVVEGGRLAETAGGWFVLDATSDSCWYAL